MKLPLDTLIVDTDDQPALDDKGDTVSLRKVLIRAVLSEFDADRQPVSGKDKLERYDLFRKVKKGTDTTDFTPEEVVAMRKASLIYPPLTAGQIRDLLS